VKAHLVEDGLAVAIAEGDAVEIDGERALREREARAILDRPRRGDDFQDPGDARAGLLEVAELPRDLIERLAQHQGVLEDQVDATEAQRAGEVERRAETEGADRAQGEDQADGNVEDRADQDRPPNRGPERAQPRVEASQDVVAPADGLDVDEADEALLDEAEDLCLRLAGSDRIGRADPAAPFDRDGGRDAEGEEHETDACVLAKHQHENPDEQHGAAEQAQDEAGEEVGEHSHVPVEPLDQLTGRVLVVKREVKLEALLG
jgi:hypothetical protein